MDACVNEESINCAEVELVEYIGIRDDLNAISGFCILIVEEVR